MSNRPLALISVLCLVGLTACPSDPAPPTCVLESMPLAGNSLTLLSQGRLDRVGSAFVLIGTDGTSVRWAQLSSTGQLGEVRSVAVPAHRNGPWFAVAGVTTPGDRVVIAFTPDQAATTANQMELRTFSVGIDGTAPSVPAAIGSIPDGLSGSLQVSMMSGRAGRHAGLTWAVRGTADISALVLDGLGAALAAPVTVARAADDFDCLRFSSGRKDLTVGYVDLSGTPPAPAFVAGEIDEQGALLPSFRLPLGKRTPGCVELTPTDTGYGIAWHNIEGTYTGMYSPEISGQNFRSDLLLADVRAGGAPALGGLGWTGKDFALFLDRSSGLEAWRVDQSSRQKGGILTFPSTVGHVGLLSSQPVGLALYGTYADYSSAIPGNESAGQRFLVKVTCP